jgi:LmbE family N-acetylglucosaminyl deacetylase
MEDHSNTCRLVCTAAFARGMRNFRVDPPHTVTAQEVTIYHALPYGLCEPLGRRVWPGAFVDVTSVMDQKRAMLAEHRSQKGWLDASQGIGAYVDEMERTCAAVGQMSGCFDYAEGWTRRLHLGYCAADADPLRAALGPSCSDSGAVGGGH